MVSEISYCSCQQLPRIPPDERIAPFHVNFEQNKNYFLLQIRFVFVIYKQYIHQYFFYKLDYYLLFITNLFFSTFLLQIRLLFVIYKQYILQYFSFTN